ncbi:hypothetical protein D3C85_1898850 [compost metagenome]
MVGCAAVPVAGAAALSSASRLQPASTTTPTAKANALARSARRFTTLFIAIPLLKPLIMIVRP